MNVLIILPIWLFANIYSIILSLIVGVLLELKDAIYSKQGNHLITGILKKRIDSYYNEPSKMINKESIKRKMIYYEKLTRYSGSSFGKKN